MDYLVRWGVIVIDADSPLEAAKEAFERSRDERNQTWHVAELDTGESMVADLVKGEITHDSRDRKVG